MAASLATAVAQPGRAPSPAPTPARPTMSTSTPAVSQLQSYLTKVVRIAIADGRVFLGMFACIDKARNIVLVNSEEFRVGGTQQQQETFSRSASSGIEGGRYVGMVMIPWKHVVSAEVETELEDDCYT